LAGLGARTMERRVHGDLSVGDGDPEVIARCGALTVLELGVDGDPDPAGGRGPLPFEVLGRGDDRDRAHDTAREQLGGDAQREGRLTRAGGGDGEEVAWLI